jgi:hypothetical protein
VRDAISVTDGDKNNSESFDYKLLNPRIGYPFRIAPSFHDYPCYLEDLAHLSAVLLAILNSHSEPLLLPALMSLNLDLSDYQMRRASLIDEDRSLRREFLSSHLRSAKEIEADKIIRKIRALEAETVWKQDHPSIPHPFPGMEFLTGVFSFEFSLI